MFFMTSEETRTVRLTAHDAHGIEHSVEFRLRSGRSLRDVQEAAHGNADGTVKHPYNTSTALWGDALELRRAQNRLREMCGLASAPIMTAKARRVA